MKALNVKFEKLANMMQKASLDLDYKHKIYELIDLDEIPEVNLINDNWVKIKVKLGGICGTDLNTLALDFSKALIVFSSTPAIFGHEISGTITEIGSNVDNFSVSDRVVVEPILGCEVREVEKCTSCKDGNNNLCSNLDKGIIPPGILTGLCKDIGGGWGEFLVAHKTQLYKIPDSVSFEEAVIVEPLATAIHGVFKKLPKENDNCVVIGCGTIGLATIIALKAFSHCKIIAIAKYPFQSELAKKFGADDVFIVKKDLHIKKIGKKIGAKIVNPMMEDAMLLENGIDVVIDSAGSASSMSNAIRLIKYNGTIIMIGFPAFMEIDWSPLIVKEAQIIPSIVYSYDIINGEKQRTFQIALDLIESGKVNFKDFLTHKFPIDDYKDALEVASNKKENSSVKTAFYFK
ncbi:MAG: alcohol dehydrogenase catalytic domain-containing protein [Candidatus Lokiarchaeia archaeon]